jgi:predicted dehydrogenase
MSTADRHETGYGRPHMSRKINTVVAGLGFGSAFIPVHRHHPDIGTVGLYDPDLALAGSLNDRYRCDRAYRSFDEVLQDRSVDAVHIVSPIPLHEEQALQTLEAGKHCACTVPMAISLEGLKKIVRLVNKTGKNYMMMETAVYTNHFFHVREMLEKGEFGKIQFLRGAHYQDMENWPGYWMGLPPMYYGTHAIAPLVMAANSRIVRTHCFGSGTMREELHRQYGNPYPMECAIFEFENGLKAEVTRSLFSVARGYTESFNIYGESSTFEWQQVEKEEAPVIFRMGELQQDGKGGYFRGKDVRCERVVPGNHGHLLPEGIAKFTVRSRYYDEQNPQLFTEEGGGHGGSHPHLVNEFVRSILEERRPWMDELVAANITAAGICAHESAMNRGGEVILPDFRNV